MSAVQAPKRPVGGRSGALDALAIDHPRRRAAVGDSELYLRGREFDLLAALASDPERVFTYEELFGEVLGGAPGVSRRVLDACAVRLRRKLELRGLAGLVAPCRGVGFRFLGPPPAGRASAAAPRARAEAMRPEAAPVGSGR
jgi:DNA-binding response OmpR family regulator